MANFGKNKFPQTTYLLQPFGLYWTKRKEKLAIILFHLKFMSLLTAIDTKFLSKESLPLPSFNNKYRASLMTQWSHLQHWRLAGDAGLIPGSGRSPREGNGNPLQYSCLGNPMNIGAWWVIVHEVARVRHDSATKQHHNGNKCTWPTAAIWRSIAGIVLYNTNASLIG